MSAYSLGDWGRIDGYGTETYLEAMNQWDLEIRQVSPGELHWIERKCPISKSHYARTASGCR
jgi:hypothetical protein